MRFNGLYLLVGATWGLVLGLLTGLAILLLGAGVSWLYLFGDDPWPDSVSWVLPLLGALGGVAVFAGSLAFAARAATAPTPSPAHAATRQGRARVLLGLGLFALAALGALTLARSLEIDSGHRAAERAGTWYERLESDRHKINTLRISPAADGRAYIVALDSAGRRGGPYRLDWRVRLTAYGADLLSGGGDHDLEPGTARIEARLAAEDLIRSYHRVALEAGAADVLVEESFRLDVALRPVLDEDERARLPENERHNLELGQSDLIERRSTTFTARFEIRDSDRSSQYRLLN